MCSLNSLSSIFSIDYLLGLVADVALSGEGEVMSVLGVLTAEDTDSVIVSSVPSVPGKCAIQLYKE